MLNPDHKEKVIQKFECFVGVSFNALALVETDSLISPIMKTENAFRNLVEGCFSGYEADPRQASLRPALRRKLFGLGNNVPIQLADILVGAFRTKIQENKPLSPITGLPFDVRKVAKAKRYAKAYYWAC